MSKKMVLISSGLLIGALGIWVTAGYLSAKYLTGRRLGIWKMARPAFEMEDVLLETEDSVTISSWFIPGKTSKAIILLPGIGGHRGSCMSRAMYYIEKGYTVMLPDLRGTGKSEGNLVSFGWHERKDLLACYEFLKKKGYDTIGVHGTSLGAATILYSLVEKVEYRFMVLESCYDDIDHAFANRVAPYRLPRFAYNPVEYFVERRLGVDLDQLKPVEYVKMVKCPVLFIAGDAEDQLKIEETMALFDNCPSSKKELFIFEGGKHEDFKTRFPDQYQSVLDSFINQY